MSKAIIVGVNEERMQEALDVARGKFCLDEDIYFFNCSKSEASVENLGDITNFIFCLPEWNGSYPWQFKRFIDAQPWKSLKGKHAYFVVYSSGNNRANELRSSLLILCHNLGMSISDRWHYLEAQK